jgi:hypothetical protein
MADFSKIKKKTRFGDIPKPDDSNNLRAPEVAPVEETLKKARRKTGRTEPFSTRVTEAFSEEFRRVGFERKLKKVELLEECFECYKQLHSIKDK